MRRPEGAEYPGMIGSASENKHNRRAREMAPLEGPSPGVPPANSLLHQAKHAAAAPPTARMTAAAATDEDTTAVPLPRQRRTWVLRR